MTVITAKNMVGGLLALIMLAIAFGAYVLHRRDVQGRAAVEEMCAQDGGNTVNETAFAPGFLTEVNTAYSCGLCEEAVGKEEFEYIDYQAKSAGQYTDEPGYYRVSLSTQ